MTKPSGAARRAGWVLALAAALLLGTACDGGGHESGAAVPSPPADSPSGTGSAGRPPLDSLRSLPYLSTASNRTTAGPCGVSVLDARRVFDGYNLFQDYENEALLMDMEGNLVHVWSLPDGRMEAVRLLPDGTLLGVATQLFFLLRWDSEPVFTVHGQFHHDARPLPDGTFLVLNKEFHRYVGRDVAFDVVEHRDGDGALLDTWSTWEAFEKLRGLGTPSPLDTPGGRGDTVRYDYFHLNTAIPLPDTPLGRRDPRFREGNWLVCARNTDLVFIVDPGTRDIVWSWGPGELEWPHAPMMLPDGTMLIFDNGSRRHFTRLVRIDPVSGSIVWEYTGTPPSSFYSWQRGLAQPLPNGNVLVTDSESARAFEITPDGDLVWEYLHTNVVDGQPQSIYQMLRLGRHMVDGLLELHRPTVPAAALERRECGDRPTPVPTVPPPPPAGTRLDLSIAEITAPPGAKGSPRALVDGNEHTAFVSDGVNPAVIELVFPGPVMVGAIGLLAGQPNDPSDRNEWWVETAETPEDLQSGQGTFRRIFEPRGNVGGSWDRVRIDPPLRARCFRVTVHRTRRDNVVHLYEISMYRP